MKESLSSEGKSRDGEIFISNQWLEVADSVVKNATNDVIVSTMDIDGVIVKQTLSFQKNPGTGRKDTVKISYSVTNNTGESHQIGVRIMLDTMIASNDYAPFKIPGYGNVTTQKELSGSRITQTYQVYDDLDAPTTMATGTLWLGDDRKPDKVQYTNWPSVRGSSWSHACYDGDTLGDSAVAIYFDPVNVGAGKSTKVNTYYGSGIGLSGTDEEVIPIKEEIRPDEFEIYVSDSATGAAVEGASVTVAELKNWKFQGCLCPMYTKTEG